VKYFVRKKCLAEIIVILLK